MLLTRKIFSVALTLLVLAYSGGINITKHLCEGKVVAKAVNSEVKKCKKSESLTAANDTEDHQLRENSCCDTESMFFQANSFEKISNDLQSTFVAILNPPVLSWVSLPVKHILVSQTQSPPKVGPPIYIAYEQFLI